MKKIYFLILCPFFLLGQEDFVSLKYTYLEHEEEPINDFLSFYAKDQEKLSFLDGDLEVKAGATIHALLKKSGNFERFSSVEDYKILLHTLAIDYYLNSNMLLSIGRESLELNLLNGSFDGAMAVIDYNGLNLKTFFFNHYNQLYPSFFVKKKLDDLYGLNLSYSKGLIDSELTFFTHDEHQISDVYTAFFYNSFVLAAEHLNFDSSTLNSESAYKLYTGYRYQNIYVEGGYYNVYEGGLNNIYALGGTAFNAFQLNSFLNQNEAQNIYADIVYNGFPIYTKLHLGQSAFKNSKNEEKEGRELGLSFGYSYKDIDFTLSYLTQESAIFDTNKNQTQWLQTDIKYRF